MALKRPSWWQGRGLIAWLWLPLGGIFYGVAALRRAAFRAGWLHSSRLPVPVVVVGNLAAGGSGKTPVAIWLAQTLRQRGLQVGIVSRGYGGQVQGVAQVQPDSDPAVVGDEPLLLARRAACPVWVGADRVTAALALLSVYPSVQVIITDDGLQHYPLRRDAEIVVIDEAALGNCWPLPAGPMREPLGRARNAALLVFNGPVSGRLRAALGDTPAATMRLAPGLFYRLSNPAERRSASDLAGLRCAALAGIGQPERFFNTLRELAISPVRTEAFADHHAFCADDLQIEAGEVLLMTEKDAVKCQTFAPHDTWVLPVEAQFESVALDRLLETLHGRQAA